MFKNQYLVATNPAVTNGVDIKVESFGPFFVYAEVTLPFFRFEADDKAIILLGHVINPEMPSLSNQGVLEDLFSKSKNANHIEKEIEYLCGRFVIICRFGEDYVVYGDASHTRQILFGQVGTAKILTSSLNFYYFLFQDKLQVDQNVLEVTQHKNFNRGEHDFYGTHTIDSRFKRLLPNHCLNLNKSTISRVNIFNKNLNFSDTVDRSIELLKGTFSAMSRRYQMFHPLTAGWDSRMLLATGYEYRDIINYYIFSRPNNKDSHDIRVPREISKEFGLNLEVCHTQDLTPEFVEAFKRENVVPRIVPKTSDIQYHYYHTSKIENAVNVNGCGGNTMRMLYGKLYREIKLSELPYFTTYGYSNEFIVSEIETWFKDVTPYSKDVQISILDLFYIENRMGNWGALYPAEQDIALEEIMPFNNKELLSNPLRLSPKERGYPEHKVTVEIIKRTQPDLLKYPINSDDSLKKVIKGYFFTNKMLMRLKHLGLA
jgi:hypothetical protein